MPCFLCSAAGPFVCEPCAVGVSEIEADDPAVTLRMLPEQWEGDLSALQQEIGAASSDQLYLWVWVARARRPIPGQHALCDQLQDLARVELRARRRA